MNQNTKTIKFPDGKVFLCLNSENMKPSLSEFSTGEYFGISIGRIHGFNEDNLNSLKGIQELKGIHIQDPIADISAIEGMVQLEYLSIASPSSKLDLSHLPKLKELRILDWNPNVVALENCQAIKSIYLNKYNPKLKPFEDLAKLMSLQRLEISQSTISNLEGIEELKSISSLTLRYFTKLSEIKPLLNMVKQLSSLTIDNCKKVSDLTSVCQLQNLKSLSLNYCPPIENLKFTTDMTSLEFFAFVETKILSGDLQPLLECKKLKFAGYVDKRGYNLKSDELNKILASRN